MPGTKYYHFPNRLAVVAVAVGHIKETMESLPHDTADQAVDLRIRVLAGWPTLSQLIDYSVGPPNKTLGHKPTRPASHTSRQSTTSSAHARPMPIHPRAHIAFQDYLMTEGVIFLRRRRRRRAISSSLPRPRDSQPNIFWSSHCDGYNYRYEPFRRNRHCYTGITLLYRCDDLQHKGTMSTKPVFDKST